VHYNNCLVRFSTHAVNGLTENDFICAAKVEAITK
jgi:4a-hydroxytetrahydrobiopterin dehydratase